MPGCEYVLSFSKETGPEYCGKKIAANLLCYEHGEQIAQQVVDLPAVPAPSAGAVPGI